MVNVASCSVSPSSIAIGGQSNLSVTLTSPAAPGGVVVIVDTDSDGSQDTLLQTPVSLQINQGDTEFDFPLQTQQVDGAATKIVFSAHVGNGVVKAAQLNIG